MRQTYITDSPQETQKVALKLLTQIPQSINLICLYGELGSGKTTFIQGVAAALGVKQKVLSPTFILMREYDREIKNQSRRGGTKIKKLIHVDCYRIESERDLKGVDLQEYWQDKENLVMIEWAERIKAILPKERIDICFEHLDEKTRKITVF